MHQRPAGLPSSAQILVFVPKPQVPPKLGSVPLSTTIVQLSPEGLAQCHVLELASLDLLEELLQSACSRVTFCFCNSSRPFLRQLLVAFFTALPLALCPWCSNNALGSHLDASCFCPKQHILPTSKRLAPTALGLLLSCIHSVLLATPSFHSGYGARLQQQVSVLCR